MSALFASWVARCGTSHVTELFHPQGHQTLRLLEAAQTYDDVLASYLDGTLNMSSWAFSLRDILRLIPLRMIAHPRYRTRSICEAHRRQTANMSMRPYPKVPLGSDPARHPSASARPHTGPARNHSVFVPSHQLLEAHGTRDGDDCPPEAGESRIVVATNYRGPLVRKPN